MRARNVRSRERESTISVYRREKMLSIKNLTKMYGSYAAVDDLSIEINAGEIYGFIGHNGAGKTTTLKSVAGILPFDKGEITIDG